MENSKYEILIRLRRTKQIPKFQIPNIARLLALACKLRFGICILQFVICNSVYSYSVFSGAKAGLGEAIYTSPRMFEFELPEELTFECIFRGEFISTIRDKEESTSFDFTFPHFRYALPLGKWVGIDIGLDELLNLNYEVEDTVREIGEDSVKHSVKSKGSADAFNLGIGRAIGGVDIMVGGFVVFGSAMEEWIRDFTNSGKTFYDTLDLNFSGKGGMVCVGLDLGKFRFNGRYFTSACLMDTVKLPARFEASINLRLDKIKLGLGLEKWQWEGNYDKTTKYSISCEWNRIYAGVYTTNWYYENIEEKVGCLGVNIPFKSLCVIGLNFEYGKRGEAFGLEEKIYRASVSICGKESL